MMRTVVSLVVLLMGFTSAWATAGYAPVGFVQPLFIPPPGPAMTKLKPIHVKTTVTFPNGFTRVFFPNRGMNFVPFGGAPLPVPVAPMPRLASLPVPVPMAPMPRLAPIPLAPVPVFPVATPVIRPVAVNTGFPVAQKAVQQNRKEPEPAPVKPIVEKPIIEKPETANPIEQVGNPVYGGTFVVNIDRSRGFRPAPFPTVRQFENIDVPLARGPPIPQQMWRTDNRPNNFFDFETRTVEGRFNIVPRINRQMPIQERRPISPPIVQDFQPSIPLDPPRVKVDTVQTVIRREPPVPVIDNVDPLPIIPIQTSHPIGPPLLPPKPGPGPIPRPVLPPVPVEMKQRPIISDGPTRGDVPNIGLVSPVPGDQGNVVMDFKDSGAAANNIDVIRNEFSGAGGVSVMKIGADAALVGGAGPVVDLGPGPGGPGVDFGPGPAGPGVDFGPGPAGPGVDFGPGPAGPGVDFGPGPAGPGVDFGPPPSQLVDVGSRAGFVDNRDIRIASENSLISNDIGMVNSNFAAHGHFGEGNGFDHIDSININIDPSLGLDFGPMGGASDITSRFNSPADIGRQIDDRVMDNNVAFDDPKLSNFEATSNFVEPAPISLMDTSFDNAAMSSKSFSSNVKSFGGNNENHVVRRTTTVRKVTRKQI